MKKRPSPRSGTRRSPVIRATTIPPGIARRSSYGKFNVGWFYDQCFKASVHLLWPCTPEGLKAYLKGVCDVDYHNEKSAAARCLLVEKDGATAYIICLFGWEPSPKWIAALSHEALHATQMILDSRGMALSEATEETYCYMQESIVRRCLDLIMHRKISPCL
jgi:hypothetical protein